MIWISQILRTYDVMVVNQSLRNYVIQPDLTHVWRDGRQAEFIYYVIQPDLTHVWRNSRQPEFT